MAVKPTLRDRLRYWFDNRFSGGPKVLFSPEDKIIVVAEN
jgi:hypothetical protein